ncbi:MAG TPA: hypothetical protein VNB24_07445 [Acidimicrobiales bacterium]|nr:hypothetical protein [Acidimicrobiales bacterium]
MLHRRFVPIAAAALLVALPATPPAEATNGVHSANMTHVANVPYRFGSDLELTTLTADVGNGPEARDFVVAGSEGGGMRLIDVTDPTQPVVAQTFTCAAVQGDIQIFTRDGRTYAGYGIDNSGANLGTKCFQDGLALPAQASRAGEAPYGTFIIDITNPYVTSGPDRVRVVGWARLASGSHNTTVDPSGRWIYSSNQDLFPRLGVSSPRFQMEIFDLADLTNPTIATIVPLDTGVGTHDVTFSADGNRAYVAAITHTVIFDTTNKANPTQLGVILDPSVSIHHQADPVDLGGRRFVVVSDELAGVLVGSRVCGGGGLHVYDVTGPLELAPVKVGYYGIPRVEPGGDTRCSSHVFRVYPEQNLMTIGWYGAGTRVLDVSGLVGVSAGVSPAVGSVGAGIREVGSFFFPSGSTQSETWAAKVHHFDADGSAYIFANDYDRGLDVFRFDASAPPAPAVGTWLTGSTARAAKAQPLVGTTAYRPSCAVPRSARV